MKSDSVSGVLSSFIASNEPRVLCIKGRWGTGKTFLVESYVEDASNIGTINKKDFIYSSVFGLNGISDLKSKIISSYLGNIEYSTKTLNDRLSSMKKAVGNWGGKALEIYFKSPALGEIISENILKSINSKIVCLDDLERRNPKFHLNDILGLALMLKEKQNNKIILILNYDEMTSSSQNEFDKYLEKVVDIHIDLIPTAREAATIAVSDNVLGETIASICEVLSVNNIRIINRIHKYASDVVDILRVSDNELRRRIVASVSVITWCHYDRSVNIKPEDLIMSDEQVWDDAEDPIDSDLHEKFSHIGYFPYRPFDRCIIQGVQRGYFDTEEMQEAVREVENKAEFDAARIKIGKAISFALHTFEDNLEKLPEILSELIFEEAKYLRLREVDFIYKFLIASGKIDLAKECLKTFCDQVSYDLTNEPMYALEIGHNVDLEVANAITQRIREIEESEEFNLVELVTRMDRGYSQRHLTFLESVSEENIRKTILGLSNENLLGFISSSLSARKTQDVAQVRLDFADKVEKVLKDIAKLNPINAIRVENFGIKLD